MLQAELLKSVHMEIDRGGLIIKIPTGCADPPVSPWLSGPWEEGQKQISQLFPTIKLQSFQTPQTALLRASDELHFCNSSSREKELGGLTLLDDSCLSCCQITGTASAGARIKPGCLIQPSQKKKKKKSHVYKTHMKRKELPITQKSLNKATQTFHVQQANDTWSLGNNITDREAVSGEWRKSIFQKYENGLAH